MKRAEARAAEPPSRAAPAAAPDGLRARVTGVVGSGTAVMLAGTLAASVGAYVFQLLGGRVLGPVAFAPVTVLWTVQFLVITVVMVPIEQMVIRHLELTRGRSSGLRDARTPLAALLLVSALAVTAVTVALRGRLLESNLAYVVLAAALVAGYSVFAVARGYLAGRHRYHAYGVATAAESVARLLLAAAVLLVTTDGTGLALVMVLAPLGVLVTRPFARVARCPAPSADEPDAPSGGLAPAGVGRFLVPLVVANGASELVLGASPLVVAALDATPASVSVVFVTFVLFRGPLWIVQSVLARILPPLTALASSGDRAPLRRWSLRLAAAGAGLALVAYPVGAWLGPDVVGLMFGQEFAPSVALASLVAAGTALAAITLFSSQLLVADGRTERLCAAWVGALLVGGLTLLVPASPEIRVGLAFLVGELTALALVTVLVGGPVDPAGPGRGAAAVEPAGA